MVSLLKNIPYCFNLWFCFRYKLRETYATVRTYLLFTGAVLRAYISPLNIPTPFPTTRPVPPHISLGTRELQSQLRGHSLDSLD